MIGRRGIAQVQFTTMELREITNKINGIDSFANRSEFEMGMNAISKESLWKSFNPNEARTREKMYGILDLLPDYDQYMVNPEVYDKIITDALMKKNAIKPFESN